MGVKECLNAWFVHTLRCGLRRERRRPGPDLRAHHLELERLRAEGERQMLHQWRSTYSQMVSSAVRHMEDDVHPRRRPQRADSPEEQEQVADLLDFRVPAPESPQR